jgi:hypothetical protein
MAGMDEQLPIEDQLAAHVFGTGSPCGFLLGRGELPAGWSTEYLRLLRIAADQWRNQSLWPQILVSSIHFASWYLPLRYEVWSKAEGRRNADTERELASLRSPSEIFLMAGSTVRRDSQN